MDSVTGGAETTENRIVYSGLDVAKATFDAGLWLPLPEGQDRSRARHSRPYVLAHA